MSQQHAPRRPHHPAPPEVRRPRRLRADGRPGAGGHRRGRHRGGRHRQRLGQAQPRPRRPVGRRLRRRHPRGVRRADGRRPRRHLRPALPPRPRHRHLARPLARRTSAAAWGRASSACRCRRARPATGCSRTSASACGGPAGCSSSPRARRSPSASCRRATSSAPPSPASCGPPTTCWRTPSSSGRCATARRFEDFEAATTGRPGFEPWNLRVALDPDGAVVGVSLVLVSDNGSTGYVDRLAVRRDQRNRGLAQALLVDSFAQARDARHVDVRAEHRLADRRARPLRTGGNGRREHLGQSCDRPAVHHGKRTLKRRRQKFPSNPVV